MKSELLFVVAVVLIVSAWIGVSMKWQYDSDTEQARQKKAFIQKLNNEKCKLVTTIAANSVYTNTQYVYECTEKSYILNEDLSDVLTIK
ncbi:MULTISPECIES: hypothetical protein [Acinetobacter]|uniref:hypothetical protein n=1 Tax=Acinetobacter TaxID=469 RepID=UPI002FE24224